MAMKVFHQSHVGLETASGGNRVARTGDRNQARRFFQAHEGTAAGLDHFAAKRDGAAGFERGTVEFRIALGGVELALRIWAQAQR
jgi:hypothetical protein